MQGYGIRLGDKSKYHGRGPYPHSKDSRPCGPAEWQARRKVYKKAERRRSKINIGV